MKKAKLSQEALKGTACLTMLVDHVAATILSQVYRGNPTLGLYWLYWGMRIVGRAAFPIYCFLLAEGTHYTKNPRKYALRLFAGAVLSELPFDLALYGGWTWAHQNVMFTLLLGLLLLESMEKCRSPVGKALLVLPFSLAAECFQTDYGGYGVALIALFSLTREMPRRGWLQLAGMALICWAMDSATIVIGGTTVSVELFALLAMLPIALYSGRKATQSRGAQLGLYFFYPAHLAILAGVTEFLVG